MKGDFFAVKRIEEVWGLMEDLPPVGVEEVPLEGASGRVLAEDLIADEDLPAFARAAMDGYAVRASDTFGASEGAPTFLRVVGEVRMGEAPEWEIGPGEAMRIPTGGMLPEGADGVVMIEHTKVLGEEIEVFRPISPLENVIREGEDIKRGEKVLDKGRRLRPQDLAAAASLGKRCLKVFRHPRVGIISTGDEIVPVEQKPSPGQVREVNRYTIWGIAQRAGATPLFLGLVRDEKEALMGKLREGLSQCDMILISGGSSVGTRDITLEAIGSLPEARILVHGVAISPGKPTIFALAKGKPIWGLPGHPTSCMVVMWVLVFPSIRRMGGERNGDPFPFRLTGRVTRNVPSPPGREDYVRVKLERRGEGLLVHPLFGKSGTISSMVEADGLMRIEAEREGVSEGEEVEVWPFL